MKSLNNKIERSTKLIQDLYIPRKPYNLGFSGGKDSIVLLDLAKKSGVNFKATYSNTTLDPPLHIKFIRDNYPEVVIKNPEKSFYKLIQEKGFPSRIRRWCCEYLKESPGVEKRNLTGIRWEEGYKRKLYKPEMCDDRHQGTTRVNPILEWTSNEIWEYIKENNLPYPYIYDPPYNFKRLGCVGCPLAPNPQRIR
ncbi:MAG: phosphoadenosine phosphosulfate reductase family protein, partial [Bacteroidales bacterium]|nr:phosphoadenosine phosphosulfate reductase family protein [Bacteroidales bacterium]